MRHQTEHVALPVTNACNVITRAIWVGGVSERAIAFTITKDDAVFLLKLRECLVVADIVSFGVCDGNAKHRTSLQLVSKWAIGRFDAHVDVFADEVQVAITNQGVRQQARFAENLKSVAYSEYKSPALGKFLD